jgi:hypothetical protein
MMGKLLASSLGFSLQANQDHHSQSPVSSMIDKLIHRRERTIAADVIGSIISFTHISLISLNVGCPRWSTRDQRRCHPDGSGANALR